MTNILTCDLCGDADGDVGSLRLQGVVVIAHKSCVVAHARARALLKAVCDVETRIVDSWEEQMREEP